MSAPVSGGVGGEWGVRGVFSLSFSFHPCCFLLLVDGSGVLLVFSYLSSLGFVVLVKASPPRVLEEEEQRSVSKR